jgi:hypothetical protein
MIPKRLSPLKSIVIFVLFMSATALVGAQEELVREPVRLTLYEEAGIFSLAVRPAIGAGDFIPLLYPEDPRTTNISIRSGNDVFRLDRAPGFEATTESTDFGARKTWTSETLFVEQSYRFIESLDNTDPAGVEMRLVIRNLGAESRFIGARLLFDTYLGERGNNHFTSPQSGRVNRETQLEPSTANPYFVSPGEEVGFQFMLLGAGITRPDRVVLANWKRLDDSVWEFAVNPNRNFNLLPYSINDSAAAVYYNPLEVAPDAERVIVAVFGNRAPSGLAASAFTRERAATSSSDEAASDAERSLSPQQGAEQASAAPEERTKPISAADTETLIERLERVNELLAELEALRSGPGEANSARIEEIRREIRQLRHGNG